MFLSQPYFVGVESGSGCVRLSILSHTRKGWKLAALKELPEDDAGVVFKNEIVVSALNTRDILMRPCEIPLKKEKDIHAALDFHVEPLLPYPSDQAILQSQTIREENGSTFLNVFAARKDRIHHHLEILKKSNLEPEILVTRCHALAALSTFFTQTQAPILIVHEGDDEISVVLLEKQRILAMRSLDRGKDLSAELQKTLLSFKSKRFETVYLLGKNLQLKNTLTTLSEKEVISPASELLDLSAEQLSQYGLAIGCALLGKSKLNFRQKEFAYPYPLKHYKKPLLLFFGLSCLLTSAVCLLGKGTISQTKQDIHSAYLALQKAEEVSEHPASLQTPEDYSKALTILEKRVLEKPDTFPLFPGIPKVKEVLAWLASLTQENESSTKIESFHYSLVSHPDFGHKKEKYKVRIDLELSAADPATARAFQEALKNSDSLIDIHEEIQWVPVKGKYKVTFYLKDKTKYG